MPRLRRFAHHRFVGIRSTMTVYDCDDPAQFAAIEALLADGAVERRLGVGTFGPDTAAEARNRGFAPPR